MKTDRKGYFGPYGGQFAPEVLMEPLLQLEEGYNYFKEDSQFKIELEALRRDFIGRPTPITFARRLSEKCGGARIYLKREDLNHTGAHKINNSVGQVLLAQRMDKKRIVAETGAGQHGVATAAACAAFGLECVVYMGKIDMERQAPNVLRMNLLGAKVVPVTAGSATLKDAVSEAMRDWVSHVKDTAYVLGSALGPHPYPTMVREFQSIIGVEAREQFLKRHNKLPTEVIACVGGGSNAIGIFSKFIADENVALTGVEAGGLGVHTADHAARFAPGAFGGSLGVLQGTKTFILQTNEGQIRSTHSISAGLDYAAVGPEHAWLREIKRAQYVSATDDEALRALKELSRLEGIIPALESAHAVAYAMKRAREFKEDATLLVNLSGRGDKDLMQIKGKS